MKQHKKGHLHMLKKQNSKGFTIIEVLIVLAIAGLIMLVVFLAVPALQRNNRNTQRKNDVSGILGAIQEYTSNSGGKTPAQVTDFSANLKPGYYDITKFYIASNPATYTAAVVNASAATSSTNISKDSVAIVTGYKCAADVQADPTRDAVRSIAIVYVVEAPSGDGTKQCQSL